MLDTVLPEPVIGLRSSPLDTFVSIRWQSSGSSRMEVEIWRDGVRVTNMTVRPNEIVTKLDFFTRYTITVYVVTAVGRSEPVSECFHTLPQ